jgi:hypothetical protein
MAKGKHPAPFRTRKLSPSAPMVLRGRPRGRVGRRRTYFHERPPSGGLSCCRASVTRDRGCEPELEREGSGCGAEAASPGTGSVARRRSGRSPAAGSIEAVVGPLARRPLECGSLPGPATPGCRRCPAEQAQRSRGPRRCLSGAVVRWRPATAPKPPRGPR